MKYITVSIGGYEHALPFDENLTFLDMAHGHNVLSNGWAALNPETGRVTVAGAQTRPEEDAPLLERLLMGET